MADETTNGLYTRYLRLAYGTDARQNRNWDILDGRALDLARELFANIPAGGDLQGYYPDPTIRDGAISDAQITDVAWTKITGAPAPFPEAPSDGKTYGRKNAAWAEVIAGGGGTTILSGVGPPDAALGVVGNYYLSDADLLYGPKLATGLPGGPAFTVNLGSPTGDTSATQSEGLTFTVSRACWLSGADHYVFTGDNTTGWVFQLWDMAGSATVPLYRKPTSGSLVAGAWTREPLLYPLQPGVTYMLSVTNTEGGRSYVGGLSGATSGPLTVLAGGYYNGDTNLDTRPSTSWGAFGPATSPVVQDTDPAALWPVAIAGVPAGGATGQVLQKTSATDYALGWAAGGGDSLWIDTGIALQPAADPGYAIMAGLIELTNTIKLGPSGPAPDDGTLQYTGTKFQGRVAGAWVDIPGAGGGGGAAGPDNTFRTITGTVTLDATAAVHISSGIANATLPLANTCAGRIYHFINPSGNNLTLTRSGSDLIATGIAAGAASFAMGSITRASFVSDGISKWSLIGCDPAISLSGISAGGSLVGTYPSPSFASNSVNNTQISLGAVSPQKLAWNAVPGAGDTGGQLVALDVSIPHIQFNHTSVLVDAGTLRLPTVGAAVVVGSFTQKTRLFSHPTDAAGFSFLTLNASCNAAATFAQDDPAKPSWLLGFRNDFDRLRVNRFAPGSTSFTVLMDLDATGQLLLPGDPAVAATVLLGTATAKGRVVTYNAAGPGVALYHNRSTAGNAQDDVTKPSWGLQLPSGTDALLVQRSPAGSTTQTNLFTVDGTGTVAVPGNTSGVCHVTGAATIKGRVIGHPTTGVVYLTANEELYSAASAWRQDDNGKPGWMITLRPDVDSIYFQRFGAGSGIANSMMTLDSAGTLVATGNLITTAGFVSLGPNFRGAVTSWLPVAGDVATDLTANYNQAAFPTRAQWILRLNTNDDSARFMRQVPSGGGWTNPATLDSAGNLTILGPTGQKSTGTTWANPSDRRIKDEIADYPTGLDIVMQLQPRTFVYNGKGGSQAGMRGYGFVADEVAAVMPEMVGTTQAKLDADDEELTDIQTVDQSNLILALVNAVKELTARVVALEAPNGS